MPLFDGDLLIDIGAETVTSSTTTGGSYYREAGFEIDVCNGNDVACSFIVVYLLGASRKS